MSNAIQITFLLKSDEKWNEKRQSAIKFLKFGKSPKKKQQQNNSLYSPNITIVTTSSLTEVEWTPWKE